MRKIPLLLVPVLVAGGLIMIFSAVTPTPAASAWPVHGTADPNRTPVVGGSDSVETIPTYFEDIEPIIEQNCVGCHLEGQIGYSTFSMDSYQDIVEYASDISLVASTRYMPPWLPGENGVPLQHDRSLSAEDIHKIVDWAEYGAPLGNPDNRTVTRLGETAGQNIQRLDADIEIALPTPYTPLAGDITDDYRCFMVELGFEDDVFVTSYEVVPDAASIVHHAIIYQAPPEARAEALARSRNDQPGWTCYGDTNLSSANNQLQFMLGAWAPGTSAIQYPPGTGVPLPAGNFIVLQIHYNTENGTEPDQTMIRLEIAARDEDINAIYTLPIFAPVEIPCPAGVDNEACDRNVAFAQSSNDFSQHLLRRCGADYRDFENQPADNVTSTCDMVISARVRLYGTFAHMHELGKSTSLVFNPGKPDEELLLDIPFWDFHWQDSYQFVNSVDADPGDVLRLTCVWDNSEGQRYVIWGDRTQDEMCLNFVLYEPLQ